MVLSLCPLWKLWRSLSSLKTVETERYFTLWLTCKLFLGFTQIHHHSFSLTSDVSMLWSGTVEGALDQINRLNEMQRFFTQHPPNMTCT